MLYVNYTSKSGLQWNTGWRNLDISPRKSDTSYTYCYVFKCPTHQGKARSHSASFRHLPHPSTYDRNCFITAVHTRSRRGVATSDKTSHAQFSLKYFSSSVQVSDEGNKGLKFSMRLDFINYPGLSLIIINKQKIMKLYNCILRWENELLFS